MDRLVGHDKPGDDIVVIALRRTPSGPHGSERVS
jgi:hypothetical protein